MKKLLTIVATTLATTAFAQEVVEPMGMQDIMAEVVTGKYRMKQASAAPWDVDIVTTSAHINALIEGEICNSPEFDVKFVKQQTSTIAKWREPVAFENVTYKGKLEVTSEDKRFTMLMESNSKGITLRRTVVYSGGQKLDWLWLGTGMVVKGMSGGPVVADSDSSIVGIVMGRPAKGLKKYEFEENKYGDLTLFVPYSVVDFVWRNCK